MLNIVFTQKQADEVLKANHDWSLFEHECSASGLTVSILSANLSAL